MEIIRKRFTLEYWPVNDWFEGRLKEIPEILAQGRSIEELEQFLREDCADLISDEEYAKSRGLTHLHAADVYDADLQYVQLTRMQAAAAQMQALSPDRQEKVFAYIEDLIDLEALERRADDEDSRRQPDEEDEDAW
jgi:hypothetical protein